MKKWLLAIVVLIIMTCGALVLTACVGGQNGEDPNGDGNTNESGNPSEHVHVAASYEITKEPTCAQSGERKGICVKCGETFTEPIQASGHDWQFLSKVDATCTEDGREAYQCSKCMLVKEYTTDEAKGHSWKLQSTQAPTCTVDAKQVYTCTVCSEIDERYEEGSALGHDWTAYTLDGNNDDPYLHTHKRYCQRQECGMDENGVAVTADMVIATRTAATCLTDAFTDYTCSIETCTYSHNTVHTDTALGHEWGKWVYSGNHLSIQTHTHNCLRDNCDKTETDICKVTTTSQAATCTRAGFTATTCEVCGNEDREEIQALEHTWGAWSIVHQSTTVTLHARQCSVCSYKDYGSHAFVTTTKPADCEIDEQTVNTCSICSYAISTPVAGTALGHEWQHVSHDAATHTLVCSNNNQHKLTAPHDYSTSNICQYDQVDGLIYELSKDGHYYIVKSDDNVARAAEITVASYYPTENGIAGTSGSLPVQAIGESAFVNNKSITTITIPNTVTSIGRLAFNGCTNLSRIIGFDAVTEIGASAFTNTGVYTHTENWVNGALYIGKVLVRVDISNDNFDIADNTAAISEYAFENCTHLTSITIPSTVKNIGLSAFRGCTNLETVKYGGTIHDWLKIVFGDILSSPMYYGNTLNVKGAIEPNLTIADGVTSIPAGTFKGNKTITQVTIAGSVTSIGDEAFKGCTELAQITFSDDNVTYIGKDALLNTSYYENGTNWQSGVLILNERHIIAANQQFSGDTYVVNDKIRTISAGAFANCDITSITVGTGVVYIGAGAFNTKTLTSLTFNGSGTWLAKNNSGIARAVRVNDNTAEQNAAYMKDYTGEWKKS